MEGLEPPTGCFGDSCSTKLSYTPLSQGIGNRDQGLLPACPLFPVPYYLLPITCSLFLNSAEEENRTLDTMIFSHVLYQLSYLGVLATLPTPTHPPIDINSDQAYWSLAR